LPRDALLARRVEQRVNFEIWKSDRARPFQLSLIPVYLLFSGMRLETKEAAGFFLGMHPCALDTPTETGAYLVMNSKASESRSPISRPSQVGDHPSLSDNFN